MKRRRTASVGYRCLRAYSASNSDRASLSNDSREPVMRQMLSPGSSVSSSRSRTLSVPIADSRVAFEEADDHFLADPRDLHRAPVLPRPGLGDAYPAGAVLVGLVVAVPVEMQILVKWCQWHHPARRRRRGWILVKWCQWHHPTRRRRRGRILVKWCQWHHPKRRAMSWAQRLKRVFSIDITTCAHCGGAVRIVASIEEPTAIRAIRRWKRPA